MYGKEVFLIAQEENDLDVLTETNVSVNSKRDHPTPPGATPGHLTPVQLHIVGHLMRIEARPIAHLTR